MTDVKLEFETHMLYIVLIQITLLLISKHQWIVISYQEENAALLPYAILCLANDYESWK